MSEWLDLLIEEIDRKKRELDEAREESARRDTSAPAPRSVAMIASEASTLVLLSSYTRFPSMLRRS